jgi:hypothetical protein
MMKRMSDTTGAAAAGMFGSTYSMFNSSSNIITRFIIEVLLYKLWNTK